MKKRIDKNYIFLIFIALLFVFIVIPPSCFFGSTMDWVSQHIAFPDYFRKRFYETGELFPNFAFSIGGGQNIFHFSYYGLFNPFILFSYFFPFLDMVYYLMGMNVFLYILSALLLYAWLKRHFSLSVSFLASVFLLCASPFLFHFHRHFMFVSYMPFLILGLMGVERYFEKNGKFLLIISTFFIILISYFYSIPSILVFILYGIFYYLKKAKDITFRGFLKDGICFVFPILLAILLASFFLLPTFYTVLSGRGGGEDISFFSLLLPRITSKTLLYSHYGIGLTSISLFALFYGIFDKRKEYKFISISICILLCFPIFSYLLNGTLYVRDKVFIPFLPLILFVVCSFVTACLKESISKRFYFYFFFVNIFFLFTFSFPFFYYIDVCITFIMIWIIHKRSQKFLFLLLFIPIGTFFFVNQIDNFVDKKFYKDSIGVSDLLLTTLEEDSTVSRTYHLKNSLYNVNKVYGKNYYIDSLYSSIYNQDYMDFYKRIFKNSLSYRNRLVTSQNNNLLYQMYMGGKYMYHDRGMIGYEKKGNHFYQNDDVFPLFYVNHHLLSDKEFISKHYPETVFSLLQNTVIEGKSEDVFSNIDYDRDLKYHLKLQKNVHFYLENGKYKVDARKGNRMVLSLEEELHNKIVLLDFSLGDEWDCKQGDSSITINGIENTFTCNSAIYKNKNKVFHYVLSDSNLKDIVITFHEGTYKIDNIHTYVLDYDDIKDMHKEFIPMQIDKKKSVGDNIEGSIDVQKDGYFVTSIPYDKGFKVYDNGKEIDYEKVNRAFLGFPIKKGFHHIQIRYSAPLFFLGKCISVFSFLILFIYLYFSNVHNFVKFEYNKGIRKSKKNV